MSASLPFTGVTTQSSRYTAPHVRDRSDAIFCHHRPSTRVRVFFPSPVPIRCISVFYLLFSTSFSQRNKLHLTAGTSPHRAKEDQEDTDQARTRERRKEQAKPTPPGPLSLSVRRSLARPLKTFRGRARCLSGAGCEEAGVGGAYFLHFLRELVEVEPQLVLNVKTVKESIHDHRLSLTDTSVDIQTTNRRSERETRETVLSFFIFSHIPRRHHRHPSFE